MQRHLFAGDGVDEEVVVRRKGVVGWKTEVVDVEVWGDRWERAVLDVGRSG